MRSIETKTDNRNSKAPDLTVTSNLSPEYVAQYRHFHLLFKSILQDPENRIDYLEEIFVIESDNQISVIELEIQILIKLFDDQFETDPDVRCAASRVIAAIIQGKANDYIDTLRKNGIFEIILAYFPEYEIVQFLPALLNTSFDLTRQFAESECLLRLKAVLESNPEDIRNYIDCLAAVSNFSAFEQEILPFISILFNYISEDQENIIIETMEHILLAFKVMSERSALLFQNIINHPKFNILNQYVHACISSEDQKMLIDKYIGFVGSMISKPDLLNQETFQVLMMELKNFLDSDDPFYIMESMSALANGYENPTFASICVESNIYQRAFDLYHSVDEPHMKKHSLLLIFRIFNSSDENLTEVLVNNNILSLLEDLILGVENDPFICVDSFEHILHFYEITQNETAREIIEMDYFYETVDHLCSSEDSEIKIRCEKIREYLEELE